MEIIHIKGNSEDFIVFIKSLGDKAQLIGIDGKFRWRVEREDGTFYIARPTETKNEEND